MQRFPGDRLRRGLALAAALSLLVSMTGVSMCVNILLRAAAQCPMHERGKTQHHQTSTHSVLAPLSGDGCHADSTAPDCASGGACPSGGPAVGIPAVAVGFLIPPVPAVPLGVD